MFSSSRKPNRRRRGQAHRRCSDAQLVADTVVPLLCAPLSFHSPLQLSQMLIAPFPLLGDRIGDIGAKHIADALVSNSSLAHLVLACALSFRFISLSYWRRCSSHHHLLNATKSVRPGPSTLPVR